MRNNHLTSATATLSFSQKRLTLYINGLDYKFRDNALANPKNWDAITYYKHRRLDLVLDDKFNLNIYTYLTKTIRNETPIVIPVTLTDGAISCQL